MSLFGSWLVAQIKFQLHVFLIKIVTSSDFFPKAYISQYDSKSEPHTFGQTPIITPSTKF